MIEILERPLTGHERAILAPFRDPFVSVFTGAAASLLLAVFLFVVGLGALGFMPTGGPEWGPLLVTAIALLGAAVCYATIQRSRRRPQQSDSARADLNDGAAIEHRYSATAAIEIEEVEDEGLTYYLQLSDGRVLLLSGQYLYGPAEEGTFPSTRFTIVRSRSGRLLGFAPTGKPFAPIATRQARKGEFGSAGFAEDGRLLEVPFGGLA